MTAPTHALLAELIRLGKGAFTALEKWLNAQPQEDKRNA
jgi:hypothetical protein